MKRILTVLPRPVLISVAVMVAAIIILAVAIPVLGGARDDEFAKNAKLNSDIGNVKKATVQAQADVEYVNANTTAFEALLKSDRLIPHTRRAAVVELENAARANRLSAFSYSIGKVSANSLKAVETQPTTGGYRVSVEDIEIKLGAPIDGSVYQFLTDVSGSFPGSAIVQSVDLGRALAVTAGALNAVSQGKDSQLVQGSVVLSWRTAQAQENNGAEQAKK